MLSHSPHWDLNEHACRGRGGQSLEQQHVRMGLRTGSWQWKHSFRVRSGVNHQTSPVVCKAYCTHLHYPGCLHLVTAVVCWGSWRNGNKVVKMAIQSGFFKIHFKFLKTKVNKIQNIIFLVSLYKTLFSKCVTVIKHT